MIKETSTSIKEAKIGCEEHPLCLTIRHDSDYDYRLHLRIGWSSDWFEEKDIRKLVKVLNAGLRVVKELDA